jgi:hypothetical protein
VLDYLISRLQQKKKSSGLSCEALIGEKFIYFDFVWLGEFIATSIVKAMLKEKLEHSVGGMTVASILHSMDGDIWSQQHKNSRSMLRLALPIATEAGK